MNYENINNILDEFRPDLIIDTDIAELARMVTLEIAYKKDIPYITVEWPKYEMYKTYSYRLGIGVDNYFVDAFKKLEMLSEDQLKEELDYIEAYKKKMEIMPAEYNNDVTSKYTADSLFTIGKRLYSVIAYFFEQDYIANNKKLKAKSKLLFNRTR